MSFDFAQFWGNNYIFYVKGEEFVLENAIIKAVTQAEDECSKLQEDALVEKERIIHEAKEKTKSMEKDFENFKKDKRRQLNDDSKLKNDEEMKKAVEDAKKEIEELRNIVKEKEQGAISLVISCVA